MNELISALVIFPLWMYLICELSTIVAKNENKLN